MTESSTSTGDLEPGSLSKCCLRQPLDGVAVIVHVHYGNARDFPDASLQVPIAGRHYVAPVLLHDFNYHVICVGASLTARWIGNPLKPLVLQPGSVRISRGKTKHNLPFPKATHLRNAKRYSILVSQFLKLSHYRVAYARDALCVEAVHHSLNQINLERHASGSECAAKTHQSFLVTLFLIEKLMKLVSIITL